MNDNQKVEFSQQCLLADLSVAFNNCRLEPGVSFTIYSVFAKNLIKN